MIVLFFILVLVLASMILLWAFATLKALDMTQHEKRPLARMVKLAVMWTLLVILCTFSGCVTSFCSGLVIVTHNHAQNETAEMVLHRGFPVWFSDMPDEIGFIDDWQPNRVFANWCAWTVILVLICCGLRVVKMNHTFRVKRALVALGLIFVIGCAVLARLVWEGYLKPTRGPRAPPTVLQMTRNRMAVINYIGQHGEFPDSLDVLVQQSDYGLNKEDLIDEWGEPIGFEYSGDDYILWSCGPDKKLGTTDDIIWGSRPSYVERWKAKHAQPVDGQGTNAVQKVTTGAVQPPVNGGTSPSQVKEGDMKKDGTVPPPSRLWLYIGIALCALVPFFYLLRRKLKTGN